jgi:hypothetical protein
VYSFDVPLQRTENTFEIFSMQFEKTDDGAKLLMAWDTTKAELPFKF